MTATPTSLPSHGCACIPAPGDLPTGLLSVTIEDGSIDPTLSVVTVGYEQCEWRAEALARHIMDWVLDFALRPAERRPLSPGRAMEIMRRAVKATFGNGNDRGVPAEILLHAVCRSFFGSDPVISKVWFKTADSDTYKGFDGVHCVHAGDDRLELWLGEAKFYKSINKAINAALSDLEEHFEQDYLHNEFAIIADKIDAEHPHADELRKMMHPNTSLDDVFDQIVVPVFLSYDSPATLRHDRLCPEYQAALEAEVRTAWMRFANGIDTTLPIAIRLFLLPMADKAALVAALTEELRGWH
jgi:hypothetical protein